MPYGYMGKILWVDLDNGKLRDEIPDEKFYRKYIGGYGLGSRILLSHMKPGADPLGPDNILGITTGTLTGAPALGGSRYIMVGKSPLTGGWGDANSGGSVGPYLRFSGYDDVFFTGISEKPVYLLIDNGKAELRDAAYLWGKDTFDTEDILKAELGKDTEIACIGPSGEKCAYGAAVMNNKGRAAARSGLGAVMGAKRLKAMAFKGSLKIPVTDEQKAQEMRRKHVSELTGHVGMLRQFGTPAIFIPCVTSGDGPVKNWDGVAATDYKNVDALGGPAVVKLQKRPYACYRCPIGCGGIMKDATAENSYQWGAHAHKPEYETLAMFGSNCLNDNLDSIIMVNDICNRYGLDTITTGSAIAFAIECYEKGIITRNDTDGLEMTWGNHKSIVAMTEKLAKREGFGNILADGTKVAAEKIGKGTEEFAMNIGGQDYPAHHGGLSVSWGLTYRMDPTPGRHTQGPSMGPPGLPVPTFDRNAVSGRQPGHAMQHNFAHFAYASGVCSFVMGGHPGVESYVEEIRMLTGWDITIQEMLQTGERIANLRQSFNIREGINPLKIKAPNRIIGIPPRTDGPFAGKTLDERTLDSEYLAAMDWDQKTARPSKKKLLELGLDDIAKEFYP
jgi:aldehyde:ferredoxin oxidoreductase